MNPALPEPPSGLKEAPLPAPWVRLPTPHGAFQARAFTCDEQEHLVLRLGEVTGKENVLVRIHSECLTGDVLGSLRCDCGLQLQAALKLIAQVGRGALVYLRGQEGRGIGLTQKLAAYRLQDAGWDTVDANLHLGLPVDARSYDQAATILKALGLTSIRVLTNNPDKIIQLDQPPLVVVERVALQVPLQRETLRYLQTKRARLGHWLDLAD